MAKRSNRNLTQLRKDNRTSNKPTPDCKCGKPSVYGSRITLGRYKWQCAACFSKPPQESERAFRNLKQLGLI